MELKHFTPAEFACPCGECGLGFESMHERLLRQLDEAREQAGVAFTITSSIRCHQHNAEVGGVDSSSHTKGQAVDIATTGSRQRMNIVRGLIAAGFTRLGVAATFVHADCDPAKPRDVMWTYS